MAMESPALGISSRNVATVLPSKRWSCALLKVCSLRHKWRSHGTVPSRSKPNGRAGLGTGRNPSARTSAGCLSRNRRKRAVYSKCSLILMSSALTYADGGCGGLPGQTRAASRSGMTDQSSKSKKGRVLFRNRIVRKVIWNLERCDRNEFVRERGSCYHRATSRLDVSGWRYSLS